MSDNPRVLRMNTLSSTRYEDVPMPAKQQLGEKIDRVDVDARSGNGLADHFDYVDDQASDYKKLDTHSGAAKVQEVTYHLDSTPPPAEPEGAPGSDSYNLSQGREPERGTNTLLRTQGNATLAVQSEDEYINTQHEVPGRNQRYAASVGADNHASEEPGSGRAADVIPSRSVREDSGDEDASRGSIQQVLNRVGDDKDKAREARDAESAKSNPRSTLLNRLDAILEDNDDNKE